MESTYSSLYRKAFHHYLRLGTPIALSMKALLMVKETSTEETPYYVWLTEGDDKVRPIHAANEGMIFAWSDPPSTGHPGEEVNCRCSAVPYNGPVSSIVNDPPIEPVYPELFLLPFLRIGRSAIFTAASVLKRVQSTSKISKGPAFTYHGAIRSPQRSIFTRDVQEAIRTAKETGNVTTQIGKYGTPQYHYIGKNGVTVIVETSGRNAGKIITFWRN